MIFKFVMEPNISLRRYDNFKTCQPGMVSSVGDVLSRTRLAQSSPDLPMRWYYKNSEPGSIPSDILFVKNGIMNHQGRGFMTQNGIKVQDIQETDNYVEPHLGSIGNFGWRNKVATVYESRRTGANFLPLPGYQGLLPGEQSRGGNTFDVTEVIGQAQPVQSVVGRGYGLTFERGLQNRDDSRRFGEVVGGNKV